MLSETIKCITNNTNQMRYVCMTSSKTPYYIDHAFSYFVRGVLANASAMRWRYECSVLTCFSNKCSRLRPRHMFQLPTSIKIY